MPLLAAAALCVAASLSGCALFINGTLREMDRARLAVLPEAAPLDAVDLEVFLIERPAGDPLTGDVLWNQLDQISSVDAGTRERLRSNGLRFGIAGSAVPYALSGLTSTARDQGAGDRTSRQAYSAPSGVTHEFPCGLLPNPVIVRHATEAGLQERQYTLAQGMFRCRVERSQTGWVELEVTPEIHYGEHKLRPQASDATWDWTGRQEVESLFAQRFRVGLNQGESLVLGATGDQLDSVGNRLLRTNPNGGSIEKLIVIRVKSIGQVQAVHESAR